MKFRAFRQFEDGEMIDGLGYDIVVHRRSIGELALPSGKLVVCDAVHGLSADPLNLDIEPGHYPVHAIIAEMRDEKLIAYVSLSLGLEEARRWETATLPESSESTPWERRREEPGFQVDSALAAVVDADTAASIMSYQQVVMPDDDDYERHLWGRVHRRRAQSVGWANIKLRADLQLPARASANLLAFDAGYGQGYYKSYAGYDAEGELASLVIDFEVLDFRFPTFAFGPPRR